ncbi:MAG: hypothetical protein AB7I68_07830 [Porticoccaceae bacterium]
MTTWLRMLWLPLLGAGLMGFALGQAPELAKLLTEARTRDHAAAGAAEIAQAEQQFKRLLAANPRAEPGTAWRQLGFESLATREGGIWVLRERADRRRGRGFYAVRTGAGAPILLQAPHQYYDAHTGVIARQLLLESDAIAAAWNTAPRYQTETSDLVHIQNSYFHAQSRAFAALHPDGRILQLHGFSVGKRTSAAGRGAAAIVSSGTRTPSPAAAALAACLSSRLGIRALLYPRDVQELGATRNTLAADLRRRNFAGFLHLELSQALRHRLMNDAAARQVLIQCLKAPAS